MRVGIEVGGTFTDLVAVDGTRIEITKVPSTPKSPDIGAFNALKSAGIDPAVVTDLVHGSTVATNAILERKGAKIAFIATKGFRDILFIQRHDRRSIYDLKYEKPRPPLARRYCYEVVERIDAHGNVVVSLDIGQIEREIVPALKAGEYEAVAICLLSSYLAPEHELAVKRTIEAHLPHLDVACSHEIACEFREYERASTTILSAYVQPVINRYLDRFETILSGAGFRGRFSVMQSNGGRLPAAAMRNNSITALFSGPAAGVIGAIRQAARSERRNLVTFDMGGTSTDVCLVENGEPAIAAETEVDGLPIRTPVLDIVTVGAGGGSLVWIDDGGMLRVGPRSSGADPGPACYGRGGTEPTISDAHVVRGTIRPDGFLGGTMRLDVDRAHKAFEGVAKSLGLDIQRAAEAAIRLSVANIVRAIQLVSTERGRDPRDYSLLPFGGAGPLLAAEIAEELGVREIVVPPNPGVVSALGLISSDFTRVSSKTCRTTIEAAPAILKQEYESFKAAAQSEFRTLGLDGHHSFTLTADMRFVGQAFELPISLDAETLNELTPSLLSDWFVQAHKRTYFHGGEAGRQIEIVGLRFGISKPLDILPNFREREVRIERPAYSEVHLSGKPTAVRVHDAADLSQQKLVGPCLVEGYSSTTWIPAGWSAEKDDNENLIVSRSVAS